MAADFGAIAMTVRVSDQVQAILLDIEGTTTPIDYVFGVLFPFARNHLEEFLANHGQTEAVQTDLQWLRQEYETDKNQGKSVPEWNGSAVTAAVPYIKYLIANDRKSTGLKSLQGKIWDQGYQDGSLRSLLFEDVAPALQRWTAAGKQIFIFSSGSVQAQQLLFRHTQQGDLTGYLSGYFDTQTGPKQQADSYGKIAAAIGLEPEQILFISDVAAELQAAHQAGMAVLFSWRPGNPSNESGGFPVIQSFDGV
jgi:enolase-phosphatase E1